MNKMWWVFLMSQYAAQYGWYNEPLESMDGRMSLFMMGSGRIDLFKLWRNC